MNNRDIAVGIDIGGTNTAFGLVNEKGRVLKKENMKTPSHGNAELFLSELSERIHQLLVQIQQDGVHGPLVAIGMGAPNANHYTGSIEHAPNLSFTGIVPIKEMMKPFFPENIPIVISKDANAAAYGEWMYGGAQGMSHFVMYTLGTGVGSGLVVNGQVVYGHDGFAGECGHATIVPEGRKCGCGGCGHLETYCSASGMKRTAFELLSKDYASQSLLAKYSLKELDSKIISEAAIMGDPLAIEVFKKTGYWLGIGLANTVCHLSPEAIFLFGGPTAAGSLLIEPTRESFERHLLPNYRNKIPILTSSLHSGDAAIIGAAAMGRSMIK